MNKRPQEKRRLVDPADRYDHEPTADDDDDLTPDSLDDDDLESIASDDDGTQDI